MYSKIKPERLHKYLLVNFVFITRYIQTQIWLGGVPDRINRQERSMLKTSLSVNLYADEIFIILAD